MALSVVCPVQDAAARWIGRACKLADIIAHPQGCRVAGPGVLGHISSNISNMKSDFIAATSKPCPRCHTATTHYRGHACHHISPTTRGCASCGIQWCFNCGQAYPDQFFPFICPAGCNAFCSDACSCLDCPDCRPGRQCEHCEGAGRGCRVCAGEVPPGGLGNL